MSDFNVRIAPSPSGTLHLGNAKTALFNYLFARKYNASFILRIEDTDQARVVKNGAENILADLSWLGIAPNTGFGTDNKPAASYTQMERLATYQKIAHQLVEQGLAYKCYCSQEELDKKREEAIAKDPKQPFKYPGTCRSISKDLDKPYVIRFKAPTDGFIEFKDIAFGKRVIPNKENYDFVLLRQNSIPLYNFAVVCDDGITDNITHIIRGSDHLKNMPQQIMLYRALNLKLPVFCHLPMLLNKDGAKLSKRDGSVSVADYRSQGYSPQAVLNYLVKFGWGYGNQELFSLDELVDKFTLEACHCRDGKFDPIKFATINYSHLKSETLTPTNTYAKYLSPIFNSKSIDIEREQLEPYVQVVRGRAKTFVEASEMLEPIISNEIKAPEDLVKQTFNETNIIHLQHLNEVLRQVADWNENSIRSNVQDWLNKNTLSLKDVGGALRVALLGKTNSPELFQVMNALGRNKSMHRINAALNQAKQ